MNKIISNIKKMAFKLSKYIKKFFSNRVNTIIVLIVLVILAVAFIMSLINTNKRKEFFLNHIYDMYPQEVRDLYSNMVSVSCNGDLYFDIDINNEIKVDKLNKNNLLDYLFSNLDKNDKLDDSFSKSLISKTQKELFMGKVDLLNEINDYQYGDYIYNVKGDKIIRKANKCESNNYYVSHLYGFSYDSNKLSMDINFGYVKDDVLYDLNNNRLGEYNGGAIKMFEVFNSSSYYRLNYIKNNNYLKLDSVELIDES